MRFRRFVLYSSRRFFIFYAIGSILLAAAIYVYAGNTASRVTQEEMQHRETVLVRTGAKLISEVFSEVTDDLLVIAASPDIKSATYGPQQKATLATLMTGGKSLVVDYARVDQKGEIIESALGTEAESVADRDYFAWAKDIKNNGQVYFSKVLQSRSGPYQGRPVIILVTPVWNKGKFLGTVNAIISAEKLNHEYVQPLYLTENSGVFLMGNDGYIYGAKFESRIGGNTLDYANQYRWTGYQSFVSVINKMVLGLDGKGWYSYRNPETAKIEKRLVAYTPVGKAFSLAVSVPVSDTFSYSNVFYSNQITVFVFFVLTILLYTLLTINVLTREEKESFEKGFRLGQERGKDGAK